MRNRRKVWAIPNIPKPPQINPRYSPLSQWNYCLSPVIPQIGDVPNATSDHQEPQDSNQPSENRRAHINLRCRYGGELFRSLKRFQRARRRFDVSRSLTRITGIMTEAASTTKTGGIPPSLAVHSRLEPVYSRLRKGQLMYPKMLSAAAAAVLLSLFCIDGASAAGECGPGFHRGPAGGCVPNRGAPAVVVAPPVVVAPRVVVPAPVIVAPPVVCGVGMRWHPGRRRCVVL
jgi:hypothetical protein